MSFALSALILAAAPFADLSAIDRQVAAFTGAAIGETGGAMQPVDRRLRLKPCAAPLALSWRTPQRETVQVQCPDAGGWRLFVPARGAPPEVAALPVVNRGDAVMIAVSGSGFTVSRPGEALESGPVGGWIRVRPVATGVRPADPMRVQVIRPGVVGLPLP